MKRAGKGGNARKSAGFGCFADRRAIRKHADSGGKTVVLDILIRRDTGVLLKDLLIIVGCKVRVLCQLLNGDVFLEMRMNIGKAFV